MAHPLPKRLKAIVALAESHGWTLDYTARQHPRLTPPPGTTDPKTGRQAGPVTFGSTPSDINADKPPTSYLRRCGVPVPHRSHTPKKGKR